MRSAKKKKTLLQLWLKSFSTCLNLPDSFCTLEISGNCSNSHKIIVIDGMEHEANLASIMGIGVQKACHYGGRGRVAVRTTSCPNFQLLPELTISSIIPRYIANPCKNRKYAISKKKGKKLSCSFGSNLSVYLPEFTRLSLVLENTRKL